ncbi:hypothetical protein LINPERHAP2_LOCUS23970 [Linum perenne]
MSAPFLTATACLFAGPAVFLNVIPTATNPGATTAADERKEEALSGAMNERRKTAVAKGSSLTEEAIVDSFRKLSFFWESCRGIGYMQHIAGLEVEMSVDKL